MTNTLNLRLRLAAALLLLGSAIVPRLQAQGLAASSGPALSNSSLPNPEQTSPQQPDADVPPQPGSKLLTNYVEAGGDYLDLTNGYGHWAGGYARGSVTKDNNVLNAEVNGQHEFGDAGVYLAAGDTYNFNSDWFG
jgi:hypothetical protein